MKTDILRELNRQNSLDSMMPLMAFTDEAKIEEMNKQGYYPCFTADSWREQFPDVDPKNVLCPQMRLFPASLIYYDPEHYICFNTNIYNGVMQFPPFSMTDSQDDPNAVLLKRIAEGMKAWEERDYLRLLLPFTSEEDGGIAIRILREMLEREEPNPKLYSTFLSVYTLCNCGAHLLGEEALRRLTMCKSEEQKKETAEKLNQFPEDVLTVYRGQASESTPYQKACSWTTDINKAYFFASWRSSDDSRILMGRVRKENILDYIDGRNEREVLVIPGSVENVRERRCVSWDIFQRIVSADMFSKKYQFPAESLARNIMAELEDVYKEAGADDHDKNHSLRVALLANYNYRTEILLPLRQRRDGEYQRACRMLADLSQAIVYHDAGRADNTANSVHGAAGYERYRQEHGENRAVQFLTTYHCRADKEAREYWERNFCGKDAKYLWTAFCVLKDADALDRVRFGNLSRDYLDVNTLRTETAKGLVPVAHQLYGAAIK